MNLHSWSQIDDPQLTAASRHEGKIRKSDENAFMKNYKSYENAFLLVTDKIAYEDKIEVKGWKCLQKKLYEGKITYMRAYLSLF